MAKRPTSVTIGTQTYTVGDTVHYQFYGEGVVEDILVRIIKHKKGSDPAAVAFDAVEHAKAQGKEHRQYSFHSCR